MEEIIFNVKGMMCGGCENRIKNAVGAIEGVESVTADHTNGKVVVKTAKNIKTEIEDTINDIGYEVVKEN